MKAITAELLESLFGSYLAVTIFAGVFVSVLCMVIVKKTQEIDRQKIRITLRVTLCSLLVILWGYCFVFAQLYPISLAYYEYKSNTVISTVGTIKSVEIDKDRILLSIDGKEYVLVYNSTAYPYTFTKKLKKGNRVYIEFGKKSKYIFNLDMATVD